MGKKKTDRFKRFKRAFFHVIKNPLTYAYISIFLILCIVTLMVFKSETKTDSGIESLFDSVWFTLVTVMAGYFDYTVKSVEGRISALIVLALGMVILSVITGKVASIFMNIQLKRDKGLRKLRNMKNHFLLCGWRPGFDKILETVLKSNPDITPDMVVLINEAPSEQLESIRTDSRFKGINYISGDYADESVLKRAHIETAERALVISDRSKPYSDLEIDSRTVLAVLTMENVNPGIYIAAELIDSKFEKHLSMAHCDEIILTADYEHSLLATASSGMGYSNVIRSLIGEDAENGIIIEEIPEHFVGKTYSEFKNSLSKDSGVLIGLLLNTGNFHQRRKDALREAQKNPNVKQVVDDLKKVKLLKSNEPVLLPDDSFVIQKFAKAIFVR